MNIKEQIDLYSDYLIATPGKATAIGLSEMLEYQVSHDKITRLLASGMLDSKALWHAAKPLCYDIKSPDAVLIIDDSILEKPSTDVSELVNYHYDHSKNREVKGVNFLTSLYLSKDFSVPVGVELVKKDTKGINKKGKEYDKSSVTKNVLFRQLVERAWYNGVDFGYVLCDSWFATVENKELIVKKCKNNFVIVLKSNRLVALTLEDRKAGKWVRIDSLELENRTQLAYLKGLDIPVLLTSQVFENKEESVGVNYLVTNELSLSFAEITTIYKKRWKVETYHQSVKQHTAMGKSPTQTVTTQTSHFIAALLAYIKLERLKTRYDKSHHFLKNFVYESNPTDLQPITTYEPTP